MVLLFSPHILQLKHTVNPLDKLHKWGMDSTLGSLIVGDWWTCSPSTKEKQWGIPWLCASCESSLCNLWGFSLALLKQESLFFCWIPQNIFFSGISVIHRQTKTVICPKHENFYSPEYCEWKGRTGWASSWQHSAEDRGVLSHFCTAWALWATLYSLNYRDCYQM